MPYSLFAAPRLLAGFGTATLLAGLGLFASSRPAHTAGGAIAVNVANLPLPVTSKDNTAQPFAATISISIANGSSGGSDNGNVSPGSQTFQVPTGKRLIVQTCSCYRAGDIQNSTSQIFINAVTNGNYNAYALPLTTGSAAAYVGSTQSLTFAVDSGSGVLANAFRNTTTGVENDTVVVSGYLVDVP